MIENFTPTGFPLYAVRRYRGDDLLPDFATVVGWERLTSGPCEGELAPVVLDDGSVDVWCAEWDEDGRYSSVVSVLPSLAEADARLDVARLAYWRRKHAERDAEKVTP